MSEKVKSIKAQIKAGSYNWKVAVETLAEKAVVINEIYGTVWGIKL